VYITRIYTLFGSLFVSAERTARRRFVVFVYDKVFNDLSVRLAIINFPETAYAPDTSDSKRALQFAAFE